MTQQELTKLLWRLQFPAPLAGNGLAIIFVLPILAWLYSWLRLEGYFSISVPLIVVGGIVLGLVEDRYVGLPRRLRKLDPITYADRVVRMSQNDCSWEYGAALSSRNRSGSF